MSLNDRLERLSPSKRELLRRRLARAEQAAGSPASERQELVGYFVSDQGISTEALRQYLSETLPEYMVPTTLVPLDEMPLSANGKVDRLALPDPDDIVDEDDFEFVEPRNPTEEKLAAIWEAVLGAERLGVHDNFLEVGGNSLMVIQLASRIRDAFAVEVTVRSVFDKPTIAEQAGLVMTGAEATKASQPATISVRRDKGRGALTFAQERLWFLDRLSGPTAAYNIPVVARIRGPLDVERLRQAFAAVVARHEVLRTTFHDAGGRAFAKIAATLDVPLDLTDLSTLSATERAEAEQKHFAEDAQTPFKLDEGPLVRAKLLRLDQKDHILTTTMSHIISDAWSFEVFLRELSAYYRGQGDQLSPLAVQFPDYASWQRERTQDSASIDYWRGRLSGELPVIDLPLDRPRPAIAKFEGSHASTRVSSELSSQVLRASRAQDATPFATVLAAFMAFLHRHTRQNDLLVGTPVTNRRQRETEALIGYFVNTVVIRQQVDAAMSFADLVKEVKSAAVEALTHGEVPFEYLVQTVSPERNLNSNPLFQVAFVYQQERPESSWRTALQFPEATSELSINRSATSKFDLTMEVEERADGFEIGLEYDTNLFEASTISRFLDRFVALLASATQDPSRAISALDLLGDDEAQRVVRAFNDNAHPLSGRLLHERFEEQAARNPEAAAVVCGDERLTYGELNRRADAVARHLREQLDVQPETLVGIALQRTPHMIVAMLGILKAGGTYVPVDPDYPPERQAFVLDHARAPVLITEEKLVDALPQFAGRVVVLDRDWSKIDRGTGAASTAKAHLSGLAYVIYTSGSTGKPKGVSITHGNASALIDWALTAYTESELEGVLASTSICFDLSVFEIFVTLSAGGKLVLVPSALRLADAPARNEVTLINTVPSAIEELLRTNAIPTSVKTINLAGEPLRQETVERLYAISTVERVRDLYGPSEDTTYSTYALRTPGGVPNIGQPIHNTRAFVLDEAQALAPLGVPGELYLAGDGVTRGYLHEPELTAERYVTRSFLGRQERVYRTGDLVRWRPDGTLQYLGRVDHQIKLRGFRVELGEIEVRLREHDSVAEATLHARNEGDSTRLVAYVVANGAADASVSELLSHLKRYLPNYMLPSAFVFLPELPMTPNGKVDKKSLPPPDDARPALSTPFQEPEDDRQATIAQIWRDLLGVSRVGARDNFFDLGGHSLLAAQVTSRITAAFGVPISLMALFEDPTVAGLARRVDALQWAQAPSPENEDGREDFSF